MFSNLKRSTLGILTVLFVLALAICVYGTRYYRSLPYEFTVPCDTPYYAAAPYKGRYAVISNGRVQVNCYGEDGKITGIIYGDTESDQGFCYAEQVTVAAEGVYVHDVHTDKRNYCSKRERIQLYDFTGKFIRTVFDESYDATNQQFCHIAELCTYKGAVYIISRSADALTLYQLTTGTGEAMPHNRPLAKRTISSHLLRRVLRAAYDGTHDKIFFVGKDSVIYQETPRGFKPIYTTDNHDHKGFVNWQKHEHSSIVDVTCDEAGGLYYCDAGRRSIMQLLPEKKTILAQDQDGTEWYNFVQANGESLAVNSRDAVYLLPSEGTGIVQVSHAPFSTHFIVMRTIAYLAALYIIVVLLGVSIRTFEGLWKGENSPFFKRSLLVGCAMVISSLVVASYLSRSLLEVYNSNSRELLAKMSRTVSHYSRYTFGDEFERLTHLQDYDNADYKHVRQAIDYALRSGNEDDRILFYCYLERIHGKVVYSVMNSFDTAPLYMPFDSIADEHSASFWEAMEGKSSPVYDIVDYEGSWTYCYAPIYNRAGKVVGILELGYNNFAHDDYAKTLLWNVAFGVGLVIVMMLMLLSEGGSFLECRFLRKVNIAQGSDGRIIEIARTGNFLYFLVNTLPMAFMVQLFAQYYNQSSYSFTTPSGAAALPMTLSGIAGLAAASCSGFFVERYGQRTLLLLGHIAYALTLVLSIVAVENGSYLLLASAYIASGMAGYVCFFTSLPSYLSDAKAKLKQFAACSAAMTCGTILGSALGPRLAELTSYKGVFTFSLFIEVLLIYLCYSYVPKGLGMTTRTQKGHKVFGEIGGMLRFLCRPRILLVILLIMLPLFIFRKFSGYAFPLYASQVGLSTIAIGNCFLLSGVVTIFLLGNVTTLLSKMLSSRLSVALSIGLIALLHTFFLFSASVNMLVLLLFAVVIFTAAGRTILATYYTSLKEVQEFGVAKAQSIFAILFSIGSALSVSVYNYFMDNFGIAKGLGLLGVIALVAVVCFVLVGREEE